MVNTDVPENDHYLKDFDMYTKSVILIEFIDKKMTRYLNLEKVWDHLRNQEEFKDYVISETRAFIDGEIDNVAHTERGNNE